MRPSRILCACGVVLASLSLAPVGSSQELLYELEGTENSALGAAVATLPDLDGDGVRDFAVGAPGFRDRRGLVRVHSGRTGTRLYRIVGPQQDIGLAWFGSPISPVGDLNGDGVAELVIGNHSDDEPFGNNGSAQVHSGVDGSLLHRLIGDVSGEQLGISVLGLDDVDGDSIPDFAAGAATPNYVRVYSGLDASLLYQLDGRRPGDLYGMSLAAIDDVDGDGVRDFTVGATRLGAFRSGYVRAHSAASGALLWHQRGDLAHDLFGRSLAATADRTGDGVGELLVGAPGVSEVDRGYVRILSGSDGATVATILSSQVGDLFGHSVGTAGDTNGDGVEDLLVGAPYGDRADGRAELYSGASLQLLYRFRDPGVDDALGMAVTGLGDLDGDGLGEVIVGAPWADPTGIPYQGAALVYRGNDLYLDPSERTVQVGDALSLVTREGTSGLPVALFLTSVDGVPTLQALAAGSFDATGSFLVAGSSCPGLAGHVLGLRSLALGARGPIDSIDELVAFE